MNTSSQFHSKRALNIFIGLCCAFITSSLPASSTVSLVSRRAPTLSQPVPGNSYSALPVYSPDGKHIIFTSAANNLIAATKPITRVDLYDYTGPGKTVILLTTPVTGSPGAPADSVPVGIAGNTLIFRSTAPDLVTGVTNGTWQLFAQDLLNGNRQLLSRNMDTSVPASTDVTYAVVSDAGRYVFFESAAGDLAGNPTNTLNELYRVDLQDSNRLELVSRNDGGVVVSPFSGSGTAPDADGTTIAYISSLRDNPSPVIVQDLVAGNLMSFGPGEGGKTNENWEVELSRDGQSMAIRRTGGNTSGIGRGVYWVDLATQQVSYCTPGLSNYFGGNASTFAPLILFPDGKTVAFETYTSSASSTNIYFWNAEKGLFGMDGFLPYIPFISTEPDDSTSPVLSPDGTRIAFLSSATNVVRGVNDGQPHLYVRVLETGETTLISHDPQQNPIIEDLNVDPVFSPDSKQLAFATIAEGYVTGDQNSRLDVYTSDLASGQNQLVSAALPSAETIAGSSFSTFEPNCLSRDGRYLVFSSASDTLTTTDSNRTVDVFLADRQLGTVDLISSPQTGSATPGFSSGTAQISPDARFILFLSGATNLVEVTPVPKRYNLYLYDTTSHSVLLASPTNAADTTLGPITHPSMSADGRWVLYEIDDRAVIRDLATGVSTLLTAPPSQRILRGSANLSADGTVAVFASLYHPFWVFALNLQTQRTVSLAIPPSGFPLPLMIPTKDGTAVGIVDNLVASNAPTLFSLAATDSGTSIQYAITNLSSVINWAMTPDASWAVFEGIPSATNQPSHQLVLLDIHTGGQSIISTNLTGVFANGDSRAPAISDDGRFITFKSEASDLIALDVNATQDIFLHDGVTGTIELISHNPSGASASDRSVRSAISGDGRTVAFLSGATDLTTAIFDGQPQLYTAAISSPNNDTDADGLPDDWELRHFGNLAQGPNDDPDHDGASNLQELAAHTNPSDSQSVLRLAISAQEGSLLSINWFAVLGVRYRIQTSSSLAPNDWHDYGVIELGQNAGASRDVALDGINAQFVRLLVLE